MIPWLLVVFLFVESSFAEYRYCVIDGIDRGAVLINTESGKDDNFMGEISQLGGHTTQFNFTVNAVNGWEQLNSENKLYVDQPVLDYRWQNFLANSEVEYFSRFLNDDNTNVFFSVRLFPESNTVDPERNKWLHLKFRNGILYTEKNSSFSEPLNNVTSPVDFYYNNEKSLWKLHKYNYLFTQSSSTELLYKNDECKPIDGGCLSLYVAACDGCAVNLRINSSSSNTSNTSSVNGTGQWITTNISLANFPNDCFNLFVETRTTGDVDHTKVYWTIGDIGFVTVNQTCEKITRYFQVSADDINKHNLTCEDSSSNKINFTSTLPSTNDKRKNSDTINKPDDSAFSLFYLLYIIPVVSVIAGIIIVTIKCIDKKKTKASVVVASSTALTPVESTPLMTPPPPYDGMVLTTKSDWKPIKVNEFNKYIEDLFCNNDDHYLQTQFSNLPQGYLKPAKEGKKPDNIKKNRYKDLYPYDENRVILEESLETRSNSSDYINASYIKGFGTEREYIATQNPIKQTVVDFFKMIWQEKVQHIVMVSSDADDFLRYWPSSNQTVAYDSIEVYEQQFTRFEFYEHRILEIKRYGETREISHLHFHAWSAIISPHIFLEFVGHLQKIPHDTVPLVLHCRSGFGRIGVIILCDIALRSGAIKGSYNFFNITKELRDCRAKMITNLTQYRLAHLIVYEIQTFKDRSVPVDSDFEARFSKFFEGNIIKKVWSENLEHTEWLHQAITPYKLDTDYSKRIRYTDKNKLTAEHSRVVLHYKKPNYIHAMFVNDYTQRKDYIVAQSPLPNTVSNFWIMVVENGVHTIVNLNDSYANSESNELFIPTPEHPMTIENLIIKFHNKEENLYYDKLCLEIYVKEKLEREIFVFNVKDWPKIKAVPESTDVVTSIWEMINKKRISQKLLFCCDDGISSSSLMTCFFYMADKMLLERKCDIVGAVRAIRQTHTSFISFEQFVFLHHCALAFYKNCFKTQ